MIYPPQNYPTSQFQTIQGQSKMIDIKALIQDQAIPCIFLQVTSDQRTCNKISLLGLQPLQRKWLLVVPPYMPPNLETMRASIRAMLIIYTCLAPFSS